MNERNRPAPRRAQSVAGRKGRRPTARAASFVPQTAVDEPATASTVALADPPDAAREPAVAPAQPRRRRGLAVTALAAVATASVVAAVVLLVTGLVRHDHAVSRQEAAEAARGSAAAAARTAAAAVLSYDYRHFASDVARADRLLTGKLRADYDKLQRTSVGPTARQVHATVTASVRGVAVLAATPTSATVLVFVDQRSDNTRIPAPRIDQNRVTMHLVRVGGRWLVSEFDAI